MAGPLQPVSPGRPSRRALLALGASTALAGVAAVAVATPVAVAVDGLPSSHPDAVLIAECERFLELERRIAAAWKAVPRKEDVGFEAVAAAEEAVEKANEPHETEQGAILERMHDLRALTLDGHRMRARVLVAYAPDIEESGERGGYLDEQMAWLLVRDLVDADDAV